MTVTTAMAMAEAEAETVMGMATAMAMATAMMLPPLPLATLSMKMTAALRGWQLDDRNWTTTMGRQQCDGDGWPATCRMLVSAVPPI
jgi:hypothetical protein